MLILLLQLVPPLFNTITSNVNTITVTTIKTMSTGMKIKFSRNLRGEGELNHNTPSLCRLSKGYNSNILGTVQNQQGLL